MPSTDELVRQRALDSYRIVDTVAEALYDDIVQVAGQLCDTPIALISVSDRDRQWFKARVGLDVEQIPRCGALCDQAIGTPDRLMEINDALADPRYIDHPLVTAAPHLRFYAGMPLVTPEGHALGTLCVIDRAARQLSDDQRSSLQALARVTVGLFEARRQALGSTRERADRDFDFARRDPAAVERRTAQRNIAVAIVELDHVVAIAAHRGSEAVEAALQRLQAVLEAGVGADGVISRHGANEFLVVLDQAAYAERKMLQICAMTSNSSGPFAISVSIGMASDRRGEARMEDVFMRADTALQEAKWAGRNRVVAVALD